MDAPTQDLSENRQGYLRGLTISLCVLASLFVGLRFWARKRAGTYWGIDDWSLLASLGVLWALLGIMLGMVHWGLGMHAQALAYPTIVSFLKGLLAFECIYVTVIAMIKFSLLLMYRRAFDIRSLRIWAWIIAGIVLAWAIAIILVCILQCQPVRKGWDPAVDGTCIDLRASFIGNGIPNIVTDIAILILPIHYVFKMVPDLWLRLQLSLVFLLGGFVLIASIYRFSTLFQFDVTDTTWTLATACAWCVVEAAIGIVSVCLPTLGPLLTWLHVPAPVSRAARKMTGRPQQANGTLRTGRSMGDEKDEYGYNGTRSGAVPMILSRNNSFERLGSTGDAPHEMQAYKRDGTHVQVDNDSDDRDSLGEYNYRGLQPREQRKANDEDV